MIFYWKKRWKCFASSKTCLTFALAFGKQRGNAAPNDSDDRSLTTFHYRQAVQPCFDFFIEARSVRNEKRTVNNLKIFIPASTNNFWQVDTFWYYTDIIYNEEFDPGSGWTLATGLTHASRGVSKELALERRPAHGWVTRIQPALHIGIAFRKED